VRSLTFLIYSTPFECNCAHEPRLNVSLQSPVILTTIMMIVPIYGKTISSWMSPCWETRKRQLTLRYLFFSRSIKQLQSKMNSLSFGYDVWSIMHIFPSEVGWYSCRCPIAFQIIL